MNQHDGKTFLFSSGTLILLLVLVLMTSCAPKEKKNNSINPIANAKELGRALGCIAAPHTCRSKEQIQKEQNEITKDFDKVDREMKAGQDQTQPASK